MIMNKEERKEWSQKRGLVWALSLGNIFGGILILSSALYFGFPTTSVDFFVVSDDYSGILDLGAFLDAGLAFTIGYVFMRPMKNARTLIIGLLIINVIFGIIYVLKGHSYGLFSFSILIMTLYFLRKPKIISYFESKEKLI